MRVLEKEEQSKGLQAPGVCFLCEQSPTMDIKVVDTAKHFAQEKWVHLAGRKYVCESCIGGLLDAIMTYVLTHPEETDETED